MVELASIRSGIGENMEDRYLFKAKRLDNGEWVQGNLIQSCDATDGWESIIIPVKNSNMFTKHIGHGYGNLGFENWYRVNPSTICQCTGLKDKNGKLIWENDVVAYWDTYSTDSGYAEADCIGEVVWDEETLSFQVTNRLSAESYEVLDECSVIGNIFDNPELLEV